MPVITGRKSKYKFFFSKNTRSENLNNLISAYLNINTTGNKFDFPAEQVQWKTDILIISKTKINESFPQANFLIDGLSSPYKLDCHSKSGGDIPSNFLASYNTPIDELICKMSIDCSYNPHKTETGIHLVALKSFLHMHSTKHEV